MKNYPGLKKHYTIPEEMRYWMRIAKDYDGTWLGLLAPLFYESLISEYRQSPLGR